MNKYLVAHASLFDNIMKFSEVSADTKSDALSKAFPWLGESDGVLSLEDKLEYLFSADIVAGVYQLD